jgi:hypothetical protein
MKHKHAEVIKAFVDGKECQCFGRISECWSDITSLMQFESYEKVRIKPEPKKKEYYDEDTFDIQYLYVYNHTIEGKSVMSTALIDETYNNWKYMGKVRLEK